MKAAGVWCALLVVAACAVDEDLHAPSIDGTPVVEEPSSIARIAGDTRTPWASGASGTLYVDQAWHYAMGYHFTPKVAGFVTHLGGFFRGNEPSMAADGDDRVLTAHGIAHLEKYGRKR